MEIRYPFASGWSVSCQVSGLTSCSRECIRVFTWAESRKLLSTFSWFRVSAALMSPQLPEDDRVDPLERRAEDRVSRYREWERTHKDDSRSSETQFLCCTSYFEDVAYPSIYFMLRYSINFSIKEINFRVLINSLKPVFHFLINSWFRLDLRIM